MNPLRILPITGYVVAGDKGMKKGEVGEFPVGDVWGRDVSVWSAVAAVLGEGQPELNHSAHPLHQTDIEGKRQE